MSEKTKLKTFFFFFLYLLRIFTSCKYNFFYFSSGGVFLYLWLVGEGDRKIVFLILSLHSFNFYPDTFFLCYDLKENPDHLHPQPANSLYLY